MDKEQQIEVIISDDEHSNGQLVLPNQALPNCLPIIPISHRPFFPAQIQPILLNPALWGDTIDAVLKSEQPVLGLCYVKDVSAAEAAEGDFASIGCVVRVHHPSHHHDHIQLIVQGVKRFRIRQWVSPQRPFMAEVEYIANDERPSKEVKAYALGIIEVIKELIPINPLYGEGLRNYLSNFSPNEPGPLADFAATLTTAEGADLQDVLETIPLLERMQKVLPLLHKELDVARLHSEIRQEVNQRMDKQQRQFFLREQLKVIQKELGITKDDKTAEVERFKQRLEKLTLPEQAEKRINEELNKLSILESGSPEYGVTRNYLDWVTSIPWGVYSEDNLDIKKARKVLEQHHDGLDDVKQRIIEFLAAGAYKGEIAGTVLLLVGPPGVGKTSIGKSIAESIGRKFYRFSVGGMRDEAEIKGHRRTYIGALPGKLIHALKEVEVSNPVIMLDEIDKIGASYQGDPGSALLEVLDPEQNQDFLDHYIDLRVDLSKVLFICTANQLDTIPAPLLDRAEIIRLSGYITEEKMAIAKHHLLPKLLKRAGLTKEQFSISPSAMRHVIESYAREAGVRQLEKAFQRIMQKAVVKLLEGASEPIKVGKEDVAEYLGAERFKLERQLHGVGIITGLAWTAMGGATLPIEATRIHQKQRGFKQTGQLGNVMTESSEIAYSYMTANAVQYGVDEHFFAESFIHLHVPEGATPKDGPSAGVTMASALLSLALNKPVRKSLAMTGEITLTGHVLPIGGVREKVVAARRLKIDELILPKANEGDFDELPDHLKKDMTVYFAEHFNQVAKIIF